MTTSAGSVASFWRTTPTVPNVACTEWPVSCVNDSARLDTTARTAPALMSLISGACAPLAVTPPSRTAPTHIAIFVDPRIASSRSRLRPGVYSMGPPSPEERTI